MQLYKLIGTPGERRAVLNGQPTTRSCTQERQNPEVAHDILDTDMYDGDGVFYGDYSRDLEY